MRSYRLGKRQAGADRTRERILAAARDLVASGAPPTVGEVARRAGVSRITVYNRFGSKAGLISDLQPIGSGATAPEPAEPREQLRHLLRQSCARWAANPALYRHLPLPGTGEGSDFEHRLAERLAESDQLRPGCSIREAEDVIGALRAFAVFDRLHRDGRRSPGAVAEILMRLAGAVLTYHP